MTASGNRIAENLARVKDQIAAAAQRSGRSPADVKLVAVTKYVGADGTRLLVEAGCRDLGESRPQDLWSKAEALNDLSVNWHMIGHLQRNKVRRTVPLIECLQSGDSLRLLQAVDRQAQEINRVLSVLIEINISRDPTKHGFAPDELEPLLADVAQLEGLQVRGLMCMAGLETDAEGARREFAALRELRDGLRGSCPTNVSLDELSMGMSRDFEVAIEEGATLVRIGSALFTE